MNNVDTLEIAAIVLNFLVQVEKIITFATLDLILKHACLLC